MPDQMLFHAQGKILLTGEYLVLSGAKALAFPLTCGQSMHVSVSDSLPVLQWEASDPDGVWFRANLQQTDFKVINSTSPEVAHRLSAILAVVRKLNPGFLPDTTGHHITTTLDFKRSWGFGSSSTLISLVAEWAGVDAFELHRLTSRGSGYDVACAKAIGPIVFQLKNGIPEFTLVHPDYAFAGSLYLIYLGHKQDSAYEVMKFSHKAAKFTAECEAVSLITDSLLSVSEMSDFMRLLQEHEAILSGVLQQISVQSRYFSDFDGVVKSLGAWGGDFVLAMSLRGDEYLVKYFTDKGLGIRLAFNKLTATVKQT